MQQIVKHFKELGCVVNKLPAVQAKAEASSSKGSRYLATLVAPLVFPVLRKKRM